VVILYTASVLTSSRYAPEIRAHPQSKNFGRTQCGQLARDGGRMRVQGHGLYRRQVRGMSEGWIVIWVRRYLCRDCGHTMSRLPDCLHPWRCYAATLIVEALYRHLILKEPARVISVRFGHIGGCECQSLRQWRGQLLCSPTLWGWLGLRLGITSRQGIESTDRGI
jgi:hypothetical protein